MFVASVVNIWDDNEHSELHHILTFPRRLGLEFEQEPRQTFSANKGVKGQRSREEKQQGKSNIQSAWT